MSLRDAHGPDPARRRRTLAATALLGSGLLGASLSAPPGSRRFYALTAATATTWIAGSMAAGAAEEPRQSITGTAGGTVEGLCRSVLGPAAVGIAAFAPFYAGALVCRRIPVLKRMLTSVLSYAHQGRRSQVLAVTLASGAAEEVFFRGALYAAFGQRPAASSTGAYVLVTAASRNPILVLAAAVMGTLFAQERRASGGVLAPAVTHLVWSTLMLALLPPLVPPSDTIAVESAGDWGRSTTEEPTR